MLSIGVATGSDGRAASLCPFFQKLKHALCSGQEALEVRNPRFISRSQERLKKLEHMAQQRRAQRKETAGQTQAPLPVRAGKRQFTVPHPLSGELWRLGRPGGGAAGRGAGCARSPNPPPRPRGDGLNDAAAAHTGLAVAPRTRPRYHEACSGSQPTSRGYTRVPNPAEVTWGTDAPRWLGKKPHDCSSLGSKFKFLAPDRYLQETTPPPFALY